MTLSTGARAKSLKLASRELTDSLGGIVASGETIGKSKTVIGRYVNRSDTEHYLNINDAAALEQLADKPFVTMALARAAGGVFIALPDTGDGLDESGLREKVMAITEELGDVSARVREALADSKVDRREGESITNELNDLIQRAVEMRELVASLTGERPVREVKAA